VDKINIRKVNMRGSMEKLYQLAKGYLEFSIERSLDKMREQGLI